MGKHSLTAIIYDKRGKILSIGKNSYVKTHPLQAKYSRAVGEPTKIYLHAEIAAIVGLRSRQSKNSTPHKIVILRFNKLGKPAPASPCKCCVHALNLAGITHIEST